MAATKRTPRPPAAPLSVRAWAVEFRDSLGRAWLVGDGDRIPVWKTRRAAEVGCDGLPFGKIVRVTITADVGRGRRVTK